MKTHLSVESKVAIGYRDEALAQWEREKIIPFEQKACNGLMMLIKNREFLTKDVSAVTCKHCLNQIENMKDVEYELAVKENKAVREMSMAYGR